jgi:MFS family permease
MTHSGIHNSTSPNHVRFNVTVNILDGAFFGLALGFASFTTIIPLFVSQLTDSAILIGLAPAIHTIGWQLPQLFTAGRVRRLSRYKPMVLAMTIHERLPFLGLALLAWFLPGLSRGTALMLVFLLLIWQGIGGGYTANVWQSMIAKIIPFSWRGGFFGAQMAAVNLLVGAAAVGAGWILESFTSPMDFTLCFVLASVGMVVSFVFIASTREEEHSPAYLSGTQLRLREDVKRILREDSVFQRFLAIRMIFQLGLVAFSYYSVYAFNELHASATQIGLLTGLLFFGEVIINPLFGALGDRKGHWVVLFLGTFVACISAILAGWVVAIPIWFIIFVLAGIANVVAWTTTMVISLGFGSASEQSTYIGLSNTLLAPVTLLSPLLAGWSIEALGYPITFRACALIFLIAAILSLDLLRNGHKSGAQPSS